MDGGLSFGSEATLTSNNVTRKITLHDAKAKGAIVLELMLNKKHPTFGEYIAITTLSVVPPKMETVYSHMLEVIETCLASKRAIPPIPLSDYLNNCRLNISVDENEDDVDHEKFIVFTIKSTFEEQFKIARHALVYALSKLKEARDEKITAPDTH